MPTMEERRMKKSREAGSERWRLRVPLVLGEMTERNWLSEELVRRASWRKVG